MIVARYPTKASRLLATSGRAFSISLRNSIVINSIGTFQTCYLPLSICHKPTYYPKPDYTVFPNFRSSRSTSIERDASTGDYRLARAARSAAEPVCRLESLTLSCPTVRTDFVQGVARAAKAIITPVKIYQGDSKLILMGDGPYLRCKPPR